MTKRLKYTKDILTHMLNNNNNNVKPPNTASGTGSNNMVGYSSKRSEMTTQPQSMRGMSSN